MTTYSQKPTSAAADRMPFVPAFAQGSESYFDADTQWTRESLNAMVVGIGGLGVVNLSRRLRDLVASRYAHVHTVEQRGVAQRRSSTSAVVLASRTEVAPNLNLAETDLLIGLEPLEALRFSHTLRPGSWCFLSDSRIETICGGDQKYAYPDTREIVAEIEQYGCRCILLPLAEWKSSEAMDPVHASSAMLGLFCAVFGFDLERVKSLLSDRHSAQDAQKNVRALEWGFNQYRHDIQMRWTVSSAHAEARDRTGFAGEAALLAGASA